MKFVVVYTSWGEHVEHVAQDVLTGEEARRQAYATLAKKHDQLTYIGTSKI